MPFNDDNSGVDSRSKSCNLISIVVPAYNESEVLEEFCRRTVGVMAKLDADYEIVFVDDGSQDNTLRIMHAQRAKNPRIAVVQLSRNFGKDIALTAGLDHAAGNVVVVIDADLQDPPELIPTLYLHFLNGYDVVYAQRTARHGESKFKKATAYCFYRIMQRIGPVKLPRDTGDFRLMSRKAVSGLLQLRERHRFMKGLFSWIGYSQIKVPYQRDPRFAGTTKWGYWRLWNFSLEGMTSFTIMPLKISLYIGILTAIGSFLYGIWIILKTLLLGEPVQGFPTIMVTMLLLSGVQLTVLGVIGEYLGQVFNETKNRPLYLVQGFSPSSNDGVILIPSAATSDEVPSPHSRF